MHTSQYVLNFTTCQSCGPLIYKQMPYSYHDQDWYVFYSSIHLPILYQSLQMCLREGWKNHLPVVESMTHPASFVAR